MEVVYTYFRDILHSLSYHYVISGDIGVALIKCNFVIKIKLEIRLANLSKKQSMSLATNPMWFKVQI